MKLYLNAEGKRERIMPMWVGSTWTRKLWCFFHGHKNAHTVTIQDDDNKTKTTCGICCKVLFDNQELGQLNPNEKNWLWNGEPVTWPEFCDRLKRVREQA